MNDDWLFAVVLQGRVFPVIVWDPLRKEYLLPASFESSMARLVVSQNERILLHLFEMDRYADEAEVPIGASQEGIAQRLQTQVHNTSRALSSLEGEGVVFDRLAHVRGAPKRRRAYFLTDKGRQAVAEIRSDLGRRRLVFEDGGVAQELPLDEVVERLASLTGRATSFLDIVDLARDADAIRASEVTRAVSSPSERVRFIERAQGRPKVDSFFGREKERKEISEGLARSDISAVLIWGMSGIGKSTLGSKLFDEYSGKRSLFWYGVREWDTEKSVLTSLSEFLRTLGKRKTAEAVSGSLQVADIYVPLSSDLAGSSLLMFIDDVQKASPSVSLLISMLSDASRYSESSKLVMMSRSVPAFFSKTALGNMSVELAGLDRDAAWEMAQGSKIPDAAQAVSESHGHPLLLSLMLRSGVGASKGDVSGFIESEVYSALTHDEKAILELLSIFRHPVAADVIPATGIQALEGLRRKALVVEQIDGLSTHDLLKEFFSSRLSGEALASLRRRAGAYCEEHGPVEWKLEALFQYVEGKEWEGAKRVALANAAELIREFPNEALSLSSVIPMGTGPRREDGEVLHLRGQLNESLGREEAAITDYQESIGFLDGNEDTQMRASVLEAMAKLQSQVERWSESFSAHEKALKLYEKAGDKEGQVREWMNLGGAHRRRRDFARAKESYNRALTLATQEENRSAQAACMNNLGLLDWDEGRLRDAETRLKESVRLSHAVKEHSGEARGLENLAELLRTQSRTVEMSTLLLESAEAFRRAEEFEDFKRLQAECAESWGDQGKFSEGIEMCRNALESPELRRRKSLFQKGPRFDKGDTMLSLALIDLLRRSGDLKGAAKEVSRYSSMAESIGDVSILAKGKIEAALISEDSGDLEAAVGALEKAEGMLRSAGDSEGLIAVHMRLGIVQEKLGLDGPAAKHYSEAARHAELVGNRRALTVALENLRSVKKNGAQG